jgi:hypothetical protein
LGQGSKPTEAQHFVPRFYLRHFAGAKNELQILDGQLRRIIRPRGPKGICREKFFYGINTGKLDAVSQRIEAEFARREHLVAERSARVLRTIRAGGQIDEPSKWDLSYLMAMMWARGPAMRAQIDQVQTTVAKQLFRIAAGHEALDHTFDEVDAESGHATSPEQRNRVRAVMASGEYEIQFDNSQHLRFLDDLKGFANLFCGQYWRVYVNHTAETFVTTDNPVVVHSPERKGFFGPTFLERTHYFALSPDLCVEALYPDHDRGKKLRRKTLLAGQESQAVALNLKLASQAERYVYCRDRQPLETILGFLTRAS